MCWMRIVACCNYGDLYWLASLFARMVSMGSVGGILGIGPLESCIFCEES